MGVAATLVISLIQSGKLWGMIACHHYSPLHLPAEIRSRCDVLAHMLSVLIEAEENRRALHASTEARSTAKRMHSAIKQKIDWHTCLLQQQSVLLGQMYASGFAMVIEGEIHGIGLLPNEAEIHSIVSQLSTGDQGHLASSFNLARDVANFPENSDFCGCLKFTVSTTQEIHLLWFRPEHSQQVSWAGDPRKSLLVEENSVRLSPRKSFEKWTESVRYESLPWEIEQFSLAENIAALVSEQKIEDASRLKTQFLANMSHEIRTPLTAIMGYADLLSEQIEIEASCERNECCRGTTRTIQRNAEHLLRIIDEILDVAKIEAGKVEILESVVNVAKLLEDIRAIAVPKADEKHLDFSIQVTSFVPEQLITDGTRLKQILMNLVNNAIKYTESGFVQLELTCDQSSKHRHIEFRVRDSGIGISHQQSRRLFNPFAQAEESMNRKFGGIGLGLAISQRFAKLLGGELQLEWSQIGKGSCFCVSLPVKDSQQDSPATRPLVQPTIASTTNLPKHKQSKSTPVRSSETPSTSPKHGSESPLRILLAEDSIDNQRLIMHLLRRKGWQVDLAENGEIALKEAWKAHCSGTPFDAILMDMQMPVMDGYEATRTLRQRGYEGPIIAVTAHAMTGDANFCIEAGCDAYTTKPIKREELFELVERLTQSPHAVA